MAALAYDKRGVGESQGDPEEWKRFNLDHLAQDAMAAFSLLSETQRHRPWRALGSWVRVKEAGLRRWRRRVNRARRY